MDDSDTFLTGYVVLEEGVRVSTEKLDSQLIDEIHRGNPDLKVVVLLDDTEETTSDDIEQRKEAIEELQEELIQELEDDIVVLEEDEKVEIVTGHGLISDEELESLPNTPETGEVAELEITQTFDSVNALAVQVNDPEGLRQLTKNKNVKQILLDYPVELVLDDSAVTINADDVWNISLNGTLLRGEGETVCVIDTGVDYTHDALGDCNPVTYNLTGDIENLTVESAHPYNNSIDITWTITKPGYTNIAIHFENISLESLSGGDALDRIYVYDKNNNTLAIYKESLQDVWSPYGEGDTLYVRLVTDGSITADGFYIDQVINGTTNTTMDWSSCSKVIGGWDTYNNDADPKDDHKHGTHVAGIVASTDATYSGIAPDAKIVAIKALSSGGSGYSSDIIAGIDWCNTNAARLNISAISMSLGCAGSGCVHHQTFCTNDLMARSINDSHDAGIAVIAAAGNGGWTDGITNPACNEFVIPAGATKSNGKMTYNRGTLLDLVAPGTSIKSSVLDDGWQSLSGTSMSTPHISAAYVLLKQYWEKLYSETPTIEQLSYRLDSTGLQIDDTADSGSNYSQIDILAAIQPQFGVAATQSDDTLNITLTADVHLSTAILEWVYPNGTTSNTTMTEMNGTQFIHNVTDLAVGVHSYTIYGTNGFSITGTSAASQITVQSTAPEITVTSPAADSYHNTDVTITATLNGSSLTNATYTLYNQTGTSVLTWKNNSLGSVDTYSLGSTLANLTDQNYTLEITAIDAAGLITSQNISFVVDATSPQLHTITHTPVDVYNNASLTFFINTSDTHLDEILFETNFSGNMTNHSTHVQSDDLYNVSVDVTTVTTETDLVYTIYVTDKATNTINSSSLVTVKLIPTNITSHANGSTIEVGDVVTFTATSGLTGNVTSLWTFGDATNSTNTTPQKQYNLTGTYVINFTSILDNKSESSSITITVVDTTAPLITKADYSSELHIESDGTNLSIIGEFFDYSPVSNSSVTFSNQTLTGYCEESAVACTWNLTELTVGSYNFTIDVTDNSSNANVNTSLYSFDVTSCSDGVQNGNEGGVDCDGSCDACESTDDDDSSDDTPSDPEPVQTAPAPSGGGGGGGGAAPTRNQVVTSGADNDAPVFVDVDAPVFEEDSSSDDEEIPAPIVIEEGVETTATNEGTFGFLTGAFTTIIPEDISFEWVTSWVPEQIGKTEIIIIAASLVVLAGLLVGLIIHRRRRRRMLFTPEMVEVQPKSDKKTKHGNKKHKRS